MVAERLRRRIASEPFPIQQGARSIEVTISIGIAALGRDDNAAARAQARRSGALSRQARRPQPGGAGRRLDVAHPVPCGHNATVNPNVLG